MIHNSKKTVLLTGASRGIGKAIKEKLTADKFTVLAPSRNEVDLGSKESVIKYLDSIKNRQIDIIINNAGINLPQNTGELDEKNIQDSVNINLISPIRLIDGLVAGMKKRKWGRIVNIASIFGSVARERQALYAATKHGLIGLTKALALELGPYDILVNSVSPGFTDTDLTRRNAPAKNAEIAKDIPLNRFASPMEIARVVSYLISQENTYINGADIVIDGGFICR